MDRLATVVLCALALLALPSASLGKDPPNPTDPCSADGRNTCGTLGVGFYSQSPYGIRWFGDYRGAVAGEAHTFCLDLGYWYPSPAYAFREAAQGTLRNRENEVVPVGNQQRLAYAVWAYGRTGDRNRQAAVMLYVHSLIGDARPREVDPAAVDAQLVPLYEQVARDAARYHGPYRVEARIPGGLTPGKPATATVRVLSAGGAALPGLQLTVSAQGATVAGGVRTNDAGTAAVTLTPTGAGSLRLTVRTPQLASTLPKVFTPTTPAAARNGQRLAAPDSQIVTNTFTAGVAKAQIGLSSAATPSRVAVGEASRDRVTVIGPLRDTVSWRAFGPFASEAAIECVGTPAATGSFQATGPGVYTTAPVTFAKPGWYVYRQTVAETAAHNGVVMRCSDPAERFRVEAQPRVRTIVSSASVEAGTAVTDKVIVEGLAGQPATVQAALYGPFSARNAIACTGQPVWTGSIAVTTDGEYATAPFTLKTPGYYTYRESIAAQGFVRAVETPCAEEAETSVVVGHPKITTRVSKQQTRPGATIFDRAVLTGLGALAAPVQVTLWGPFATRTGIRCSGTPYWTGSFVANGDGTYTTASVLLKRAGYFVYQESIVAGTANSAFTAPCADVAETTFARAGPLVTTIASAEVVLPGARLHDRIRVRGLGQTPAAVDVELYGPFASLAAIRCTGRPFWQGRVYTPGDGELRSPGVPVQKVGFYAWRERIVASALVPERTTGCPLAIETSLVRPLIITGRGDRTRYLAARATAASPARVRLGSLGIDAPVAPARIDIPHGILGVPPNIHRTASWVDGAEPGATSGATLIAGHADSATGGAGAFFRLKAARAGDRIEVVTAAGKTLAYRVTSVRTYLKRDLPAGIYSRRGSPRLVLVTCGGPFDEASGHYRDNIVVTAVPV